MLDLVLTKAIPTSPGWYWSKDHHGVLRVEQVYEHPEIKDVMTVLENTWCGWQHRRIANTGRLWAGPIPRPLE